MNAPILLIPKFIGCRPGLLFEPDRVFEWLWDELPWIRVGTTPRRECWMNDFGSSYTYGSGEFARTYDAAEWHLYPQVVQQVLVKEVGDVLEGCFVNGYEDGYDHLGWHSDDSPEIDAGKPIAIISLGAEREIWFREIPEQKGDQPEIEKLVLPHGSLLVMNPGMQQTHQHRIPKASFTPCGPRLSLTYRGLVQLQP